MTVTLTLNEITAEQAEKVLDLLREDPEAHGKSSSVKSEQINPDEFEDSPSPAEDLIEETETENHSIEEVRSALAKLGKTKGKEAAKAVLAKFGVSKVTELNPKQYAAVLKEVG